MDTMDTVDIILTSVQEDTISIPMDAIPVVAMVTMDTEELSTEDGMEDAMNVVVVGMAMDLIIMTTLTMDMVMDMVIITEEDMVMVIITEDMATMTMIMIMDMETMDAGGLLMLEVDQMEEDLVEEVGEEVPQDRDHLRLLW